MMSVEEAKIKLQNDIDSNECYHAGQLGRLPRTFVVGELEKEESNYYVFSLIVDNRKAGSEAVFKKDGRFGAYPFPQNTAAV